MSGFTLGDSAGYVAPAEDDDAVRFINRVLPAARPGERIGLHWFDNTKYAWDRAIAANKPHPSMGGRAYDSASEAVGWVRYISRMASAGNEPPPDIYICMARCGMSVAKASSKGNTYFLATRNEASARRLRAFYADLDVKEKGYASKADALAHVDSLVATGALPNPTVRIDSGNGIHLHWVIDRDMTPQEWRPYAIGLADYMESIGLKFDRVITVDCVRVLRVPATFNVKKRDAPVPTAIIGTMDPNDIPVSVFDALLGARLVQAAATAKVAALSAPRSSTSALPDAFMGHTPFVPATADTVFAGGINPDEYADQKIDFGVVVERCPTLSDIRDRHGAGDTGFLWGLALLSATFAAEDERSRWAHEFSSGFATYTPAETEAKLAEKLRARISSNGRIGWPSCRTFSAHSTKCQSCPFFAQNKTPFHQGILIPVAQAAAVAAALSDALPPAYHREQDGIYFTMSGMTNAKGDPLPDVVLKVLPYDVIDAYIEELPDGPIFSAQVVHDKNPDARLRVALSSASSWQADVHKALASAGIALLPDQLPLARRFIMSFIQLLQARQENVIVRDPFGWVKTRAGQPGFAFDGRVFCGDGTEEPSASTDDHFRTKFCAKGDIAPWKEAADLLMGMGRIDLQVAFATAFAGPLMKHTGENGVIVSVYSPHSGVQKSTAIKVAQSVWGDPRTGMTRIDDTANAVGKKIGSLRHLPVYWDEVQSRGQSENFAKLAFALTMGTEKSRMGADTKLRQTGEWATMLICGSNHSIREVLFHEQAAGSAAGVARVFELEVRKVALTSSSSEAAITLSKTHENFGLVGVEYARLLASMHDKLPAALAAVAKSFEDKVGRNAEQRFWIAAASTIYLGAALANKLVGGTLLAFPLPAVHAYLCDVLAHQQAARVDDVVDIGTLDGAVDVVQGYINWCRSTNTALETNTVPSGPGRPKGANVESRFLSEDARRLLRDPKAHIIHDDGRVRFILSDFRKWVTQERKMPFDVVRRDLEAFGAMTTERSRWAAGTPWSGAITKYFEIDVHYGRTPLGARIGLGK